MVIIFVSSSASRTGLTNQRFRQGNRLAGIWGEAIGANLPGIRSRHRRAADHNLDTISQSGSI
jgi:hypothetical protein